MLLSTALISCQQIDFDENFIVKSKEELALDFNVSLADVNTFLEISESNNSLGISWNIEPVIYSGDTLLYIVNYDQANGWKIISADKRTQCVFAEENTGEFELDKLNPGIATWIDDLAERIFVLKKHGEFDTSDVSYNIWSDIKNYRSFKSQKDDIKTMIPPDGIDPENGYWQLVSITSTALPSFQVGPLVNTKWGQGTPWNSCVPYNREYTERCLTGCVAVAGAQMLYYLHYNISKPLNMYSVGSCYGWSEDDASSYYFNFSNSNSTTWDLMAKKYYDAGGQDRVSTLMGFVGNSINMDYSDEGSSASTGDLESYIKSYNIDCNYTDYNYSTVLSSLNSNMPVIVRAERFDKWVSFLGINLWKTYVGHAWLIDGYETTRTEYTRTYEWVVIDNGEPTEPSMYIIEDYGEKTETYVSATTYLIMNWGWDGSGDLARYSLISDWEPYPDRNYIYDRKMMYGFN